MARKLPQFAKIRRKIAPRGKVRMQFKCKENLRRKVSFSWYAWLFRILDARNRNRRRERLPIFVISGWKYNQTTPDAWTRVRKTNNWLGGPFLDSLIRGAKWKKGPVCCQSWHGWVYWSNFVFSPWTNDQKLGLLARTESKTSWNVLPIRASTRKALTLVNDFPSC